MVSVHAEPPPIPTSNGLELPKRVKTPSLPPVRGPIASRTVVPVVVESPTRSAGLHGAVAVSAVLAALLGIAALTTLATVVAVLGFSEPGPAYVPVVVAPRVQEPADDADDDDLYQDPPPDGPRRVAVAKTPVEPVVTTPTGPGPVTVAIADHAFVPKIEVRCAGGYHERASVVGGTATLPDVPADDCTLTLKGGVAAAPVPVSPRTAITCDFPSPANANCH